MRTNLLYVYERKMGTAEIMETNLRVVFAGDISMSSRQICAVRGRDIAWADCIFFVRPDNIISEFIAKEGRKAGAFLIFYMDDDLFHLPGSIFSMPWRKRALKHCRTECDVMASSNANLVEKYRNRVKGKRGVVIDTAVTEQQLHDIPQKVKKKDVNIVYAASLSRTAEIDKYIFPVLNALDEGCSGGIRFTFVGAKPENLRNYKNIKVQHVDMMPLEEYRKWMTEQDFDIGLAPLDDTPFNRCKYFNKYIEYTLVGIVGIYSDCKPYTDVVRNGYNGLLAEGSPDAWIRQVRRMIDDVKLRDRCLENAKTQMEEFLSPHAVRERVLAGLPELVSLKKDHKRGCRYLLGIRLTYFLMTKWENIYLCLYYFRHGGIKKVVEKIGSRLWYNRFYRSKDV